MTADASAPHDKATLHRYLKSAQEALLWKLEGLSDYDVRRPMTPTGTNLLGLLKHVASVSEGYLGEVMGRPSGISIPWYSEDPEGDVPNADFWATADETREEIIDLYQRVAAHCDATIEALDLDAPGRVPWWGDRGEVTLQVLLVHLIAEINRHAGHADIIRELIDGAVGVREGMDNMWSEDVPDYWARHRQRLEDVARAASGRA